MKNKLIRICIVGTGPRGLSVLERLCASAGAHWSAQHRIQVHVVDPYVGEGGAVWRTGQSRQLLMNTVAAQVTMFADDSVTCTAPVVPGPSLYEWTRLAADLGDVPEWVRQESLELGPDSYPTRALYGQYLLWVLRRLLHSAPENLDIELHPRTAVALADAGDETQMITLSDGSVLSGLDAVVLAQGHLLSGPSEAEEVLADYARQHRLNYVPPANAADVDLSFITAGQPVALRGFGLTFFDYMALLTVGRGGKFTTNCDGKLVYERSGEEPELIVGSRRGIPYHARGENQKGVSDRHEPLFLTPGVIADLRRRADRGRPANFCTDVWPLIDSEVRSVYYSTLIAERHGDHDARLFLRRYQTLLHRERMMVDRLRPFTSAESAAEDALLAAFGVGQADRWRWRAIDQPYGDREFADGEEYEDWLVSYLNTDVSEADRGNVRSPLKAALDAMRDLRNEIRQVVDHGGLSGDSYRNDLQSWYTPFNAFVSIGPPASRIRELIALIESGVVQVVGARMVVDCPSDGSGFVISSSRIPGPTTLATTLIEARLPEPDLDRTTDPLLRNLLASGECAAHRIPVRGGGHCETAGLAVTPRPYNLLDAERNPHPRRFAFGVPTETVHWVTAAGIRPGVNSVIVADADAIAQACIGVVKHQPQRRLLPAAS
ncbi:FAD/NAD(P)-binding protein [Saccharopolyspora shandongensis]|uniref:FAD/NAD(P)-binding protein n=1 Tax=Saccharopolyspora shandongensis TaxID=418495 RepID=UPI003402D9DA